MVISGFTHSPDVVLHYLRTRYPEVNDRNLEELSGMLPARRLSSLAMITTVLQAYCELRGFQPQDLNGNKVLFSLVTRRKEFLALLLLLYQPEKLYSMHQHKTFHGIAKKKRVPCCSANGLPSPITFRKSLCTLNATSSLKPSCCNCTRLSYPPSTADSYGKFKLIHR